MSNAPPRLDIASVGWFDYDIRAAALRLLIAGAWPEDFQKRLHETMTHPRLREIVQFLALYGFGALHEHHNHVTPLVHETIGGELELAEGMQQIAEDLRPHWSPTDSIPDQPTQEGSHMKVRMLQGVAGQVENVYSDLVPGDVIEVGDEARAQRYIDHKLCEPVDQKTPVTSRALKAGAHY